MTENEIKKDLYKSKEIARFAYYDGDTNRMYYQIKIMNTPFLFPINVFEKDDGILSPASDLKGAKFGAEIKGCDLNRWIIKAFNKGDLMKLS
jgi:hypothetical protein